MTPATPLPNHLVIVCGHGIWLGGPAKGHEESEWLIESYKAGETPTFVEHIKAGIRVLADDERAVVAFSGGPTRRETPLSEGRSYANLAAANNYFGLLSPISGDSIAAAAAAAAAPHPLSPIPLHRRIIVEEQALDSYYNILFSLLAFWRHVSDHVASISSSSSSSSSSPYSTPSPSAWPIRLTIVSHAFKRSRLVDGHCGPDGLAFLPLDQRISFIGISPPNLPAEFGGSEQPAPRDTIADKKEAMKGAHTVIGHWAEDPHGVGDLLAGKRRARNPWAADQRLFASEEERHRSGLRTRQVGSDMEALADDSPRPWNDELGTVEDGDLQ